MQVCFDKILCLDEKPDLSKGKIFFGEYNKFVRIDFLGNEAVRTLKENAESNTWFVTQLDYSTDRVGWESIPDVARRMFLYNINYQNAMDSGVTNGFLDVMVPIITDPNWQLLYIKIGYEESIHSESYSHALVSVFGAKATEYLDLVYSDPFIQERLRNEVNAFSEVRELVNAASYIRFFYNEIAPLLDDSTKQKLEKEVIDRYKNLETDENKLKIVRMIISNLYLEGIKFPLSFYVTWNINREYGNPIQGIDNLLKEIAYDELYTHVPTGNLLLKTLREDDNQGFKHLWDKGIVQEMAVDMVKRVIEQEDKWIDFLTQEGEIPGFTKEIARHFIRYYADVRLQAVGADPIYGEKESDIIKWFKEYSNVNLTNTALQETDNTTYQKNNLKNDYSYRRNELLTKYHEWYEQD